MNDSHKQIPLNFKTGNHFTFDGFIVENNAAVINSLKSFESLNLPITERIHKTIISLPISPVMTENEVNQIIQIVNLY